MRCQRCDANNPGNNRFCAACGASFEIACPQCGRHNHLTEGLCGWCGTALPAALKLSGVRGERKQATILFADVVESTRLVADMDAEQATDRLRPVLAAMARAARRFDGTIIQFLGDGLKALFGAPNALEGHALLACRAALAIQEAVAALPDAPLIRVGLHSGEVVVDERDTGSAIEFEAGGVTVHLASRLEQLAEPGSILLSGECARLVRAWCDTEPLGLKSIKGFGEPIEVRRLIGLRALAASDQFRDAALSPFVGRADELASLRNALAAASQDRSSAIGISAEPGVGKSRLCHEFAEECRRRGIYVLEARASVFGHATPMQLVLELLRCFLGISLLDEPAIARNRIADRLLSLNPSFEADLPLVGELLGVGDPEKPPPLASPQSAHARLRDIVSQMIKAIGRALSVIVIEDLHWLDSASSGFIETVVDAISGTRILLVLNFRSSYQAVWMDRAHYKALPLSELGVSDIGDLVRDLVGGGPEVRAIRAQVASRSSGNPFFAEELVMSLAEGGTLVGGRGNYRAAERSDVTPMPATLEAVIGARIDRLSEREKTLLQIGATIGKEFPLEILLTVAEMPLDQIESTLARIADADLIQTCPTFSGRGYSFRHPLIQEVSYAMQLRARRLALHAAVATAIERCEWGHLDEFAGLLAHHFEAAGQTVEAARHLFRSATWVGRSNSSEAFRQWKKTRQLLGWQAASDGDVQMRAVTSAYILTFGWREGMTAEEAAPYAAEALRYAREAADPVQGPQLLAIYGRILASTGSADDYVAFTDEGLATISAEAGVGRKATLLGSLTMAHTLAGFLSKAKAASELALDMMAVRRRQGGNAIVGIDAPPYVGFDVEKWIKCQRARLLLWLGRFEEAEAWLADACQVDETSTDTAVVQYIPHLALVELACYRNEPATARRHAEQIVAYAELSDAPYLRVQAPLAVALAKTASGDFVGAARDLQDALNFARGANAGLELEPRLLAELSYAEYCGGDTTEAARTAQMSIALAQRRAHRIVECQASMVRAAGLAPADRAATRREVSDLFRRADHLIDLTGAALLAPRLEMLRADAATVPE
jgi:adenylate cyclase